MLRASIILAIAVPCAADDGEPDLKALAARCGSEIRWLTSLDDALRRAGEERKPVLWYVPSVSGSPTYKGMYLDRYMQIALFTDEDAVDLINRRFVPLRRKASGAVARELGIVYGKFLEPGFVFLAPDGKRVHAYDRLRTLSADHFVHVLRRVLARSGRPDEPAVATDPYPLALHCRRQRDGTRALDAIGRARVSGEALTEHGLILLKLGRIDEAVKRLSEALKLGGTRRQEAAYLLGVAKWLTQETAAAQAIWRDLCREKESRWIWRAAANLVEDGPFAQDIEEIRWLPEDVYSDLPPGTERPLPAGKVDEQARRGVEWLLLRQRGDGSWRGSRYDWGGRDALPNVWMAVTALCATALLEHRDIAPERVDRALERAEAFMVDERNTNPCDYDEYIWALIYRLLYWSKQGKSGQKMNEVVRLVEHEQAQSGAWHHEYPNAFVTAAVIHALKRARDAGANVPDATVRRGSSALGRMRGRDGTYAYSWKLGRGSEIEGAAGRMPLCELGRVLAGDATLDDLKASCAAFFEHKHRIEAVRKYDMHADEFSNGGFFFWFDVYGASEAVKLLPDRKEMTRKLLDVVLATHEADGSWVDDHEMGKPYGTAMALLTLRNCLSDASGH